MFSVFSLKLLSYKIFHIKTGTLERKSKRFILESFHLCSENVFDYLYHDVPTMTQTTTYGTLYLLCSFEIGWCENVHQNRY